MLEPVSQAFQEILWGTAAASIQVVHTHWDPGNVSWAKDWYKAKPESEIMGCNWCKNWTMAMTIQKKKQVCRNPCHLLYILALLARLLGPVPSCCWVRKLSKAAVPSRDEARLRIQPQCQEKQSASHTCLCMCLCPGWSSTSEFFGPVSEIVFHFSLASWGHMRTWWILGTLRLGTSLTCSKQAWQNIWPYRDCQEPCT